MVILIIVILEKAQVMEAMLNTMSDDKGEKYLEILNRSKNDLEQCNNLLTFTMEELEVYTRTIVASDNSDRP